MDYATKLQEHPSGVFTFFVAKGDSIKYKLKTIFNARMDWWAMATSDIIGNENTLSGHAMDGNVSGRKCSWITGSYYKTSFGIDGTSISVY